MLPAVKGFLAYGSCAGIRPCAVPRRYCEARGFDALSAASRWGLGHARFCNIDIRFGDPDEPQPRLHPLGAERRCPPLRRNPRSGFPLLEPGRLAGRPRRLSGADRARSEEHTSELQSRFDLVCRLLLEKK